MYLLELDIGDIAFKIILEDDSLENGLTGSTSEQKSSAYVLRLKIHHQKVRSNSHPVNIILEKGKMIIDIGGLISYVDLNSLKGEINLPSNYSFNLLLRNICSVILIGKHGIALHASSLVRHGNAYLFPGKSGAGKTTIAKLSPDSILLTEEFSIVRKADTRFIAYRTPFNDPLETPGENIKAPVAGIFFPIKDKKNFLVRLSAKSALMKILPNVVLFGQDQDLMQKAFELTYDFASSVPCYDLHFVPEPSFWECIDEINDR